MDKDKMSNKYQFDLSKATLRDFAELMGSIGTNHSTLALLKFIRKTATFNYETVSMTEFPDIIVSFNETMIKFQDELTRNLEVINILNQAQNIIDTSDK